MPTNLNKIICIHGGAGVHKPGTEKIVASALKRSEGSITKAIMALESDPAFNCGFGSNFTISGAECEASYMTSNQLAYGAVANVSNCKHPIYAAKKLSEAYSQSTQWALIPPMVLTGAGADQYCASLNIGILSNQQLCSSQAQKEFDRAKMLIQQEDNGRMDTVGGVAIEANDSCESCASSGGLILKADGRLGSSAHFGAAIWSEQRAHKSISVSLSGCGESLIRTFLAENLATLFFEWDEEDGTVITQKLSEYLDTHFLHSPRLQCFPPERILFGGVVLLRYGGLSELVVVHNTSNFVFAYSVGNLIKRQISCLKNTGGIVCESFIL